MYKGKSILAIIPARGGSKGIPKKNIADLGGKPLIAYTIKSSLESEMDKTIVSTDDFEIAEVSRNYGAEVPFTRPKHLASDEASSLSVILHALNYIENEKNHSFDIVALLQPTSPFRNAMHINKAIRMLVNSDSESVIDICRVTEHPLMMYEISQNQVLKEFIQLTHRPLRRQDWPGLYITKCSMAISKRSYFDRAKDHDAVYNTKNVRGFIMDYPSSIDINELVDLQIAQAMLSTGIVENQA